MNDRQQLEFTIAALEAQRSLVGDAVTDAALAPMRVRLAGLVEHEQSLRHVTVLFMDVVGSTALSQHLDPEEIGSVMDGALARATAIVEAQRGKVLKYAGDSLLAAFGAEQAREDDTERAVRCGLGLLELGRNLGIEVAATHGHAGFDVRVGIHTGGVLLGGGVDAEGSIRGIAVNIAARMEQAAPPGALRISHETYTQVRGMFEVQAQEPLAVKGVDTPIRSYLVRSAKPRSFRIAARGIEGVATRMIGRDVELDMLKEAFKQLLAKRRLAVVTVVADAGLGKSRLLTEFEAWSEARPEAFFLFRGRATPQTQAQPFGLLREIFAWRFQIADDDSLEVARSRFEQGVIPLFEQDDGPEAAEGHAHLLGHLLGIDWRESRHLKGILHDPLQIRNRARHTAAQIFRRIGARDGALAILQIEDLHWADDESLDFLNYLVDVDRDVPLLMLSLARPTLFERRPDWCSDTLLHQRIDLAPLDKSGSRQLADELLKKLPEVPAALRELITGGAEGNPFYMEELVKMLIDQGAIHTGEHWRLDAHRLLAAKVPSTLTGVLQARLDGLTTEERLTLQCASVIGPVFWERALIALFARALQTLPGLVRRELVLLRSDGQADGLREYAFKHQILHQVVYGTVLKRSRREFHGRLAQWLGDLAATGGLRAGDFLGITAEHYEQAGDDAQAAEFHARAAEHAAGLFAHGAALSHVDHALVLLDRLPARPDHVPLRWRLLVARERVLDLRGDRERQGEDLDTLDQLAEALDDDRRRTHAAWRRSARAVRMADWPGCAVNARRAISLAERARADDLRLLSLRLLGLAMAWQGDLEAARDLLQPALSEARALGLKLPQAHCLNTLAMIAGFQDDLLSFLELECESLSVARAMGDRANEAIALGNVGAARMNLGDLEAARKDAEESLRLVRANGDRAMECASLVDLSQLARWQGDDTGALTLANSALVIAVEVQARDWEVNAACKLGDAELAQRQHAAAAQAFERAQALAREIGDAKEFDAAAGLARVALAQGALTLALGVLKPLLAHVAAGGTLDGTDMPRVIELTCYRVLHLARDPGAEGWLQRAHDLLQSNAARIGNAGTREMYLTRIPHHREISVLWDQCLAAR